jgi:hypothetical protein
MVLGGETSAPGGDDIAPGDDTTGIGGDVGRIGGDAGERWSGRETHRDSTEAVFGGGGALRVNTSACGPRSREH